MIHKQIGKKMDQKQKKQYLPYILCGIVLIVVLYLKDILSIFNYAWKLIFPFLLGGAIAFVISVPMSFVERYLLKIPKMNPKLARVLSLILTLLFIFSLVFLILFFVVPELGNTFISIGEQAPKAYDKIVKYIDDLSINWPELQQTFSKINWDSMTEKLVKFAQTSASGLFSSGINVISGIISGVMIFFVGFIFSLYVLLQKETLAKQGKKILYALLARKVVDRKSVVRERV